MGIAIMILARARQDATSRAVVEPATQKLIDTGAARGAAAAGGGSCSTAASRGSSEWGWARRWSPSVLAGIAPAAVEAFLPKLVGETTHRERPAVVAGLRERIRATPPWAIANALHGLAARSDSRETLPTIAVPTLVLVGAEDVPTPPPEAETMAAAIPRARLDIIPGAGHLANLECPAAVNAALRAFLGGVSLSLPSARGSRHGTGP